MTDDRSAFTEARDAGLKQRHETREQRAVRRQVASEITMALEYLISSDLYSDEAKRAFRLCAEIAHQFGAKDPARGDCKPGCEFIAPQPIPPLRSVHEGALMTEMDIPEAAVSAARRCLPQGPPRGDVGRAIAAALPYLRHDDDCAGAGASHSCTTSEPTFTASEVKELTTKATEVALALGRKEALDEVAGALIAEGATQRAIAIVRSIASQPYGPASNGLTVDPATPTPPEDPKPSEEAL